MVPIIIAVEEIEVPICGKLNSSVVTVGVLHGPVNDCISKFGRDFSQKTIFLSSSHNIAMSQLIIMSNLGEMVHCIVTNCLSSEIHCRLKETHYSL